MVINININNQQRKLRVNKFILKVLSYLKVAENAIIFGFFVTKQQKYSTFRSTQYTVCTRI